MTSPRLSSVADWLKEAQHRLSAVGIDNAAWEIRQIAARTLNKRPLEVLLTRDIPTEDQRAEMEVLLARRLGRQPLAYVLGDWDFAGLRLEITPDVLVPRPETEELFEMVSGFLTGRPASAVADVGTGSGALALALATAFPEARVSAFDISEKALAVASRNARRLDVAVDFAAGDLLAPAAGRGPFDAIVANLPYVRAGDIDGLEPEVLAEPRLALDGGDDGLALVRRLAPQAFGALKSGGGLFLEIAHDQARDAASVVAEAGFADVSARKDLSGNDRFVRGVKP